MTHRLPPESLEPIPLDKVAQSGAVEGNMPRWNNTTQTWVPAKPAFDASDFDTTTPIADGQVWSWNAATQKYVPAANGGVTFNASQTGLVTIHDVNDASETIVPGLDAPNLAPGRVVSLSINLWVSQNRPGYNKYLRMRVRDGGLTGGIVYSYDFPAAGDSTNGHAQQFAQTVSVGCSTGRLVVTLQSITGALTPNDPPAVYSDTRALSARQDGRSALRELVDVDLSGLVQGDALLYNDATGKFEAGPVATGGGGGGTDEVLLLEADQDATDVPPETPVGAIVFRKVIA